MKTDIHPDLKIASRGHVAVMTICRPPHNYFDIGVLKAIGDALEAVDTDPDMRVGVLAAEGKSFCAGADFSGSGDIAPSAIYGQTERIFARKKPLVAAVQGPAVGGGFGLAVAADFRIASPRTRFHANFARLGLHPGFAITFSLPRLVGAQRARELLLSARRVGADQALAIGLADTLGGQETIVDDAVAFAETIAINAPLSLLSIRAALSDGDAAAARRATQAELEAQNQLFGTADFAEGVKATAERREPVFTGK